MRFYFTIDVDWVPGSEKGLVQTLENCKKFNILTTLFVAGRFAVDYPQHLRNAILDGHEIGCHGWEHGINDRENFLAASYEEQKKWIVWGTQAIESATGTRPQVFRAPNLWLSETTLKVLIEEGYRLDSSVPAQRYDFGYGQCNYLKYFGAPLEPYYPSSRHLGKRGKAPIIEVPPSAYCCIPINMSALRVLGHKIVAFGVRRLARKSSILVFYLHPSEFVAPEEQQILPGDPRRYRQGIGPQNFIILERFLNFVLELGYQPGMLSEEIK